MNLKNMFSEKMKKNAEEIQRIKSFLLIIVGYGLILNYAFLIIFNTPFRWYGFPAFGIAYYFIMEEFVAFWRKIKARNIQ
jgi:hypothetical protein